MERARWRRPSCLVMMALLVLLLAALAWLASGDALMTPNPSQVTRDTPAYDKDVPSDAQPGGGL